MGGGSWLFGFQVAERILKVLRTVLLARLLAPDDFGLFGVAMLALGAIEKLTEPGFEAAILRRKDDVEPYLDTAFTLQVARGIFVAGIVLWLAPYLAAFFNEPRAIPLLRVLSIAVVVRGFTSAGVLWVERDLDFRRIGGWNGLSTVADFVVSVVAAWVLRSAWALVWGVLAGAFVRMFFSYFVHPFRPSFRVDRERLKELVGFARWTFVGTTFGYIQQNGDSVIVGYLMGSAQLGYYQLAYTMGRLPHTELGRTVTKVAFPYLADFQDDLEAFRHKLSTILQLVFSIAVPLSFGLVVIAGPFVRIVLGAQWLPMVFTMQILALWGIGHTLAGFLSRVFFVLNRPDWFARLRIYRALGMLALAYPAAILWGIEAVAVAVLISTLAFETIPGMMFVGHRVGIGLGRWWRILSVPAASGTAMVAVVVALRNWLDPVEIPGLLLLIGAGAGAYVTVFWALDTLLDYRIKAVVMRRLVAPILTHLRCGT